MWMSTGIVDIGAFPFSKGPIMGSMRPDIGRVPVDSSFETNLYPYTTGVAKPPVSEHQRFARTFLILERPSMMSSSLAA